MEDKIINTLKLFFYIQKINFKTAFLSKYDALINLLMIMVNNFSFIFMWWVIFQSKHTINGWNFSQMALLFAVANNSFATYAIFAQGIQRLPEDIENGNLDNYLVSPRNTLFILSTSESTFANWGDYLTGFIMFFVSGYISTYSFTMMVTTSLLAFMVVYGFRLIVSSLAFFIKDSQRLGDNIFMAFLTFGSQPASIFSGWYKVMFLTVIPSGFVSLFPVELIRSFGWEAWTALCLGALVFFCGGICLFNFGLRYYVSGNRFGVR